MIVVFNEKKSIITARNYINIPVKNFSGGRVWVICKKKKPQKTQYLMIISFYLHSSNCLKGYHDYNCGLKCQYLKYGDRCGDKCQCRPRYCDHVYGCPPQGKKKYTH